MRGPPLTAALAAGALLFGLVAGQLVAGGNPAGVAALALVVLPVVLWKRPHLAPAVIMVAALGIEQFWHSAEATTFQVGAPTTIGLNPNAPFTAHIPLFHGLGSLHLSPADFLLLALVVLYFAKRHELRSHERRWAALGAAVVGTVGAVALGVVIGTMHHGSFRVSLMEARPFVYLGTAYLLASVLITSRSAIRAVLWGIVLGTGLKAAQGVLSFLSVRHMHPRPEAILGHEEAFFFGLFILLTLALWLFDIPGRLRTTATWLLPLVVLANLVNNRRAAWVVLGGGLVVLAVVGLRSLPARRPLLSKCAAVTLVVSAVYLPAFWNHTGSLAQPARALHSLVSPDPRDAQSDLYRIQENANLKVNIAQAGAFGKGFGVRIDYPLPIADIRSIDPFIDYIPHNGVLYILMRMGILGGVAFWTLLAAAIITGCRLARSRERELALIGALLASAVVGYAFLGAVDQGFFFYRVALVLGTLLGLGEAASRLDRAARRRAA
jgi:hypothetical protein